MSRALTSSELSSSPRPRLGNVASVAGTTRLTAGNVKPGTAAREAQAKKMVVTGCGCQSNFASRSRCRSCRYQQQRGQSGRKPQFTQSTFAAVVAEEAAKLHAQLGQGAIDVPMMETGQDVAPSEEAERVGRQRTS